MIRRRWRSSLRWARTRSRSTTTRTRPRSRAWRPQASSARSCTRRRSISCARRARRRTMTGQDEPDFDIKMEALQPLLWGKAEAHFSRAPCGRYFLPRCAFEGEFGLRAVIIHGTEAHLGRRPAGRGARSGGQRPVHDRPFQARRSATCPMAPGLLCKAGIENRHYGRPSGNSPAAAADGAYAGGACGYG